ncbi:hypothetical protein I6N96_01875 [Enterococcus sp. BWM-S5]|uniref:Uncharacterized protein n=1 Tax=Enterococcus larvae TaxID=2794352 RepID=A0ABS4CFU4_9ENTE|nr:hypothetical protein [Enterococcus larvae]MBP1045011.1 hypothetical protein [Enterococcus larvae]
MKVKKIVFGGSAAAVLIGVGFGFSNTIASEEYVSIPNQDVKTEILTILEENESVDENALSNLRNFHYISKGALQNAEEFNSLSIQSKNNENPENSSLEGLQGMFVEDLAITMPIIDITPLAQVRGVKSLSLESTYFDLGYTHGIRDLNALESWTELESFYYQNMTGMGEVEGKTPLLDISALSNITTLRNICIETAGTLDPIYLSVEDNNYETTLPVTLSNQFNGVESWNVNSESPFYMEPEYEGDHQQKMSDKLRWESIEEGTEYLDIWVQIQPRGQYYIADIKIPIIWE